jgi:hypothetical protein
MRLSSSASGMPKRSGCRVDGAARHKPDFSDACLDEQHMQLTQCDYVAASVPCERSLRINV